MTLLESYVVNNMFQCLGGIDGLVIHALDSILKCENGQLITSKQPGLLGSQGLKSAFGPDRVP